MKKVVIIFPKDSEAFFDKDSRATFGGASTQLYLIAKELHKYKGLKTYSFINNYNNINFDDANQFNLVKTFTNTDTLLKKVIIFHKRIKEIKPDFIIQRGLTLFSCLLSLYCKIYRIKFIFMFAHDRESMGRYQKTNKRNILFFLLLRFSEIMITQSEFQKNFITSMYTFKTHVIKSGHDMDNKNVKKRDYILWVGRLEPWKRPEMFIELAKHFPKKEFIMIAPALEGFEEYGENISRLAQGIHNIRFIPFVKFGEIDNYFRDAKIFINTSNEEGFPNTFIQSCKNKTPIVSLSVNPDNFLDRHDCGFYCNDDFSTLINNVQMLLLDKKNYRTKSNNAFLYARNTHNIKTNVKILVEFITRLKVTVIFPKDSEALFCRHSNRTFGGANVQMYLIAKELSKKKDMTIYSFIPEYDEIDFADKKYFNLIKTYKESDNLLKKIWMFHKRVMTYQPEVIIQRGLTLFSCFMALYCKLLHIKFIFMFAHDIESHGFYQSSQRKAVFFQLLLKYSHLLIVQNEYEYNNIPPKYESKKHILKKGLELAKIKYQKRKNYDCIWIARCERWKRPELFIDLARVNKKLNFLMICSKVDKNETYFDKISNMAKPVSNLEFIDFVDNQSIYEILSRSKVFCITSEMEGDWPMTVLESAASKLPILSFNLSYGNLFSNYNAGYLCDGNIEKMNEYFINLLSNKKLYNEKSNGAYQYILDNHDINKNVDTLLGLL